MKLITHNASKGHKSNDSARACECVCVFALSAKRSLFGPHHFFFSMHFPLNES